MTEGATFRTQMARTQARTLGAINVLHQQQQKMAKRERLLVIALSVIGAVTIALAGLSLALSR